MQVANLSAICLPWAEFFQPKCQPAFDNEIWEKYVVLLLLKYPFPSGVIIRSAWHWDPE